MSSDDEIYALFAPLYSDLQQERQFNVTKPLLAHYTSLDVFQKIMTNNEIWFSNPLFMNDLEELRFGVLAGVNIARENQTLKAALNSRFDRFIEALDHYFKEFEANHVLDTYVFCTSEHSPDNNDGVLSMWRGYGSSGNGVAIVFDTAQLNLAPAITPLVISDVKYATSAQRQQHLAGYCELVAGILTKNEISDDKVYLVSYLLFERIKTFALFTKHKGFSEEREWRLVYRHELDRDERYKTMFGYNIGSRGVEPKLKFKIEPVLGVTSDDLSLEKIINRIVLGPATSSILAKMSVVRMLKLLNRDALADRVVASTIPLRPQ